MALPSRSSARYDLWRCGWCDGFGFTSECWLEPAPLWRVGEHLTLWCAACEERWPWRDDDWRRRYNGSPFRLLRHLALRLG